MTDVLVVAIALLVGVSMIFAVLLAVAKDGYGHNPPPRSHRREVAVTQHQQLLRLTR